MRERLPVLAAALWWGSLCAMGFVAVPLLFAHLPTPALAVREIVGKKLARAAPISALALFRLCSAS